MAVNDSDVALPPRQLEVTDVEAEVQTPPEGGAVIRVDGDDAIAVWWVTV
jgi:hypothetical protein